MAAVALDGVRKCYLRTAWTARPEFRVGYDELHQGADNAASAGFVLGAVGKVRMRW
jgi:hypothetical protein